MARIVMDPDARRRELLACAMRLFAEKGYDNVSVRAVAREAGVASGLAYHYFDSKERMFAEAIEDYARRCAEGIAAALDEKGIALEEKVDRALAIGLGGFPCEDFFHAGAHGALHDRLSLAICEEVRPHLRSALELDAVMRGASAADADGVASMMTYGCVGLASCGGGSCDAAFVRRYLRALVAEFRAGAAPA